MTELLFKITYPRDLLDHFFFKFAPIINHWYQRCNTQAYLELIQGGFVYIIKDLMTFQKMAVDSQATAQKGFQKSDLSHQLTFEQELRAETGLHDKDPITFHINCPMIQVNQMIPLWQTAFAGFGPTITFQKLDAFTFTMTFQNITILAKYLEMFFALDCY